MGRSIKQLLTNAVASVEIGYRVLRGLDFQSLSQYVLRINAQKEVDGILAEVSQCLQSVLGYTLFGFVLKKQESLNIWIDPSVYSSEFAAYVKREFSCQNTDYRMHFIVGQEDADRHKTDRKKIDHTEIMSYKVMDGTVAARMYILPNRQLLNYHTSIISTVARSLSIALEKSLSIATLENAVAVDPLTNCYNRRALDNFIENDIAYAQRHKTNLSIIMFDLDNFKQINDHFGHQAGDVVLKEIAGLITSQVRKSDYLVRYGGEEFVLVLPDNTLYDAVVLAHKLRKIIANHAVDVPGGRLYVTASFGVSSLEGQQDSARLLREADERMYKAKATGKNTVVPSLLPCFADRRFLTAERSGKFPAAI